MPSILQTVNIISLEKESQHSQEYTLKHHNEDQIPCKNTSKEELRVTKQGTMEQYLGCSTSDLLISPADVIFAERACRIYAEPLGNASCMEMVVARKA